MPTVGCVGEANSEGASGVSCSAIAMQVPSVPEVPAWLIYVVAGVALLLTALLPRLLAGRSLSPAIVFVSTGVGVALIPGTPDLLPSQQPVVLEHAAEFCVIVALMGVGLALDRPFGWRRWAAVWRLLLIGMPVMIAVTAIGASLLTGAIASAALLLGAVLAPTDPVLASDVRVGEPTDDPTSEDELRFSLSAEAGLNDALAFPFVWAAILLSGASGLSWIGGWIAWELIGKVVIGASVGILAGLALGYLVFRAPVRALRLAEPAEAIVALAAVFLAYGGAEAVGGYGFLAVFATAVTLRSQERGHAYHGVLHGFINQVERIATLGLLVVFGYAIGSGLLSALTWQAVAFGFLVVLVVRPAVAWLCLAGLPLTSHDRRSIAFFGVKGIGSLYYMAFALTHAYFADTDWLWATVAFTILVSVLVHGITATPVVRRIDAMFGRHTPKPT